MTRNLIPSTRWLLAATLSIVAFPDPSTAQRRNRDAADNGETGGRAIPRSEAPAAPAPPPPAPAAPPPAEPAAREPDRATNRTVPPIVESDRSESAPRNGARLREGQRVTGAAVPRGSVPAPRPKLPSVPAYRGHWPWGYGGLGFGTYYGAYYDPYVFYGPYDPWYGYGLYAPPVSGYAEGSLRLKVRPREAQVFADGYYVGIVDEFDGVFQRLHLPAGSHRIEIRAPGWETLLVDVQIRWDETTTYEGALQRLP